MKIRPLFLIASLLALFSLAAVAETVIYSPKDGLADGWKSHAWSGPVLTQVESDGATMLQVALEVGSQAYCGVALTANRDSGIELTEKLRESGTVEIQLKPGKTIGGQPATEPQPLQISLAFATKDGEPVPGKFSVQTKVLASEPETTVTFTMPEALKGTKDIDQLASISGMSLQYLGDALSGFSIIACTVKD